MDATDNLDVDSDARSDETDSSEPSDNTLHFSITLSADEWREIKGGVVSYRGSDRTSVAKNYGVLEPGWTSVIAKHIHTSVHPNLQCCLTFRRAEVYPYGGVYLNICGHCKICNSSIQGKLTRENFSFESLKN